MIPHSLGAALAATSLLALQAGAASAQNTTDPATGSAPPATGTDRPTTSTPTPAPTSEPATSEPATPRSAAPEVVTVPVPVQQAPLPQIQLQDQPYPNGFADPNVPFGNDMSVQVREEGDAFDWGLLGVLGLLGLFGLRRPRDGYRQVVQQERYEDGLPPRV
jgi:MYXO-CTERM domain-containing protein